MLRGTGRLIWLISAGFIVVLALLGTWTHRQVERSMERLLHDKLMTILNADVEALRIWLKSQEATAQGLAANPAIAELIAEAASDRPGAGKRVAAQLTPVLEARGYRGFVLIGPGARLLYSTARPNDPPRLLEGRAQAEAERVLSGDEVLITQGWQVPANPKPGELQRPVTVVGAPVKDASGETVALLALFLFPEEEFSRILRVARSGDSGETYAVDERGRLLSSSRFSDQLREIGLIQDDTPWAEILTVELRDPGANLVAGGAAMENPPLTLMAESLTRGEPGVNLKGYRDYRGVQVVGAWTWLPEYGFGVATEIDRDEGFMTANVIRTLFRRLLLLLAVGGTFLAGVSWLAGRFWNAAEARKLGQYTLERKLGEGGMGEVYLAAHSMLRRPTAIKIIKDGLKGEAALERFENEVQATSRLSHPNTVAIYDYGRSEDGVFYYAMEYLRGLNLRRIVEEFGPMPEARVVWILRQVLGSLAEAHGEGIVHRDIKPSNIMLCRRGGEYDVVQVLDFGLVADITGDRHDLPHPSESITGTPHFMAPELALDPTRADPRADLYALGATVYYLATAEFMFEGKTATAILVQQGTDPVPPFSSRGVAVSPEFERLVMACLEKKPEDRPASAADLTSMLRACPTFREWDQPQAQAWWDRHRGAIQQLQSQAEVDLAAGTRLAVEEDSDRPG